MMKRMLQQNNKAFTYVLTVSFLIIVLLVIFLTFNKYSYQDRQELHQVRIRSMNDFITDFDQDIHRATYIASFRTLLALEDHVSSQATFFDNTEDQFAETFFFGTINGTNVSIMNDSSMEVYLEKVNQIAADVGLVSSLDVLNVTLNHSDPWTIAVFVTLTIQINDTAGTASWQFNETYKTEVSIFDLRDPLYSYHSANKIPNTIRVLNESDLVDPETNDTTNLIRHINDSYYRASSHAPTFLQRFENNLSAQPYGIESIVNLKALSDQDIEVFVDRIKVDYMYFNDIENDSICDIDTMPANWHIILPDNRIDLYNLSTISYSTSCP